MTQFAESMVGNEAAIRLACFAAIFVVVAVLEGLLPRRDRSLSRAVRWPNNLAIVGINTVLLRVLFPTALVAYALTLDEAGRGLLNGIPLPEWLLIVLAVLLLDLLIYVQHVLMHLVPPLWRLHRVHHADPDFDVTTGLRFHPLEIVLSLGIKFGIVTVLGPPAVAVLVFEVLLNAGALFSHGNLRLPLSLDRIVRLVLVTPDMHRVHHSVVRRETDSNYGFCLSWWDRLFRTYRAQPEAGHDGMEIGIGVFSGAQDQRLVELVKQPFRSASS